MLSARQKSCICGNCEVWRPAHVHHCRCWFARNSKVEGDPKMATRDVALAVKMYPLVILHSSYWKRFIYTEFLSVNMVVFHSILYVYQRVSENSFDHWPIGMHDGKTICSKHLMARHVRESHHCSSQSIVILQWMPYTFPELKFHLDKFLSAATSSEEWGWKCQDVRSFLCIESCVDMQVGLTSRACIRYHSMPLSMFVFFGAKSDRILVCATSTPTFRLYLSMDLSNLKGVQQVPCQPSAAGGPWWWSREDRRKPPKLAAIPARTWWKRLKASEHQHYRIQILY